MHCGYSGGFSYKQSTKGSFLRSQSPTQRLGPLPGSATAPPHLSSSVDVVELGMFAGRRVVHGPGLGDALEILHQPWNFLGHGSVQLCHQLAILKPGPVDAGKFCKVHFSSDALEFVQIREISWGNIALLMHGPERSIEAFHERPLLCLLSKHGGHRVPKFVHNVGVGTNGSHPLHEVVDLKDR